MEEVFTCICGHQLWTIYDDRIACPACGREYSALHNEKDAECSAARAFNANRGSLLIREAS